MATTVRLHPVADEALKRLRTALESEEGRKATQEEIVAALVWGTSAAQAAGMLTAFTRAAAD
jgi:hypothetical protein